MKENVFNFTDNLENGAENKIDFDKIMENI